MRIDVVDKRSVHQHHPVVHPDSAIDLENDDSDSDSDEAGFQPSLFSSNDSSIGDIEGSYPVEIPERYKSPISMDLMVSPMLLNDGYFYNENEIWEIRKPPKSPNTNEKLVNGRYIEVPSFVKELKAFADAIKAEREQSEPNYQPILNIAEEAEKTADGIREQITLWIQDYKTRAGLISEIAKDENNYACISKALSIALVLHPESRKGVGKDIRTSTELKEVIFRKFQSNKTEMISWFLSLCCEPKAPNGMKECLIKALQEAMMEAHNFPEKFAALAKKRTTSNIFSFRF